MTEELKSPVRPLDWTRAPSRMYPVGDGHLVREF
jgi:peptide/nickel transport system ATP-binding protein